MTEAEWLASADPMSMLKFLMDTARFAGFSDRKKGLLFAASYRVKTELLARDRSYRSAIEVFEKHADGLTEGLEKDNSVRMAFRHLVNNYPRTAADGDKSIPQEERFVLAHLFRDIVGNPYRPLSFDVAHRTPTVVSRAQAAYDERQLPRGELNPHRLAVLADALEEVGAPAELLSHLRGNGSHVRGCHVVDLCLGRG